MGPSATVWDREITNNVLNFFSTPALAMSAFWTSSPLPLTVNLQHHSNVDSPRAGIFYLICSLLCPQSLEQYLGDIRHSVCIC